MKKVLVESSSGKVLYDPTAQKILVGSSIPKGCCGYGPFYNPDTGLYYSKRTLSGCDGYGAWIPTGFEGVVPSNTRFKVRTQFFNGCPDAICGDLGGCYTTGEATKVETWNDDCSVATPEISGALTVICPPPGTPGCFSYNFGNCTEGESGWPAGVWCIKDGYEEFSQSVLCEACCLDDGNCIESVTAEDCRSVGGVPFWNTFIGGPCYICTTPCCRAFRITGHVTGTVEYFNALGELQCTWNIDDTLEYTSYFQDNGCDEGYPGCCLHLASGSLGPVSVDVGTSNEHTVYFGFSATDNFDGTADIFVAAQIDPNYAGSLGQNCNNAATVNCGDGAQTGVDCNGSSFNGSKSCSGTAGTGGQTHYSLTLTWSATQV